MSESLASSDAKALVRRDHDEISLAYRDDVGDANKGYPLWLQTYQRRQPMWQ